MAGGASFNCATYPNKGPCGIQCCVASAPNGGFLGIDFQQLSSLVLNTSSIPSLLTALWFFLTIFCGNTITLVLVFFPFRYDTPVTLRSTRHTLSIFGRDTFNLARLPIYLGLLARA